MKKVIILSFLVFAFTLNADEFPLVKPISVEKAPLYHIKTPPIKKVKIEKPKIQSKEQSEEFAKTQLLDIKFELNGIALNKKALEQISKFAQYLKTNKGYQVVLYGYTDSIGSKHENLVLSQKRVDAIEDALIKEGISSTRLTAVGQGEKNPIGDNMYKEGREKNRRIEALIIK